MPASAFFSDDMKEIVESFVVETREILESLDNDLLRLEETPGDRTLVDKIFRSVHTVKGTSGFLSLEQLSVLAHHFEDVLNRLRRQELAFHPGMMDVMLRACDLMKVLLRQVETQRLEPIDMEEVVSGLVALSNGTFSAGPAATQATGRPEETAARSPADEDAELEALFAAFALQHASAPADDEPATDSPTTEGPATNSPATEGPATQAAAAAVPAAGAPAAAQAAASGEAQVERAASTETIRVEVGRLDHLMNLVGELVLGRNRLLQLVHDLHEGPGPDLLRAFTDTSAQVDFTTTELQAAILQTRMVQIGRVFNKFPRVVRDLAREFDKQIDLVLEGSETELDKSLIEEIGDPLVHLIRNAADHGVEQPAARLAAGKPAQGTIRLSAAHQGNHIVIVIEDDGAGMHPERLKRSALEKGLISAKEAAEMSDNEAYDLIFRPGFSTAQQISHVSGRGVGMDVVKTNITRLNGTVSIDSQVGRGTRFTLKLPLTLAIIQSLLVRVGAETFAIPLHAIVEVVGLQPGEVQTIRGREVLRYREQVLPLIRVGKALDVEGSERPDRAYAVVVGIAHQRLGLVVDSLIGQKEIVIKPLGAYLQKIPGIAGSTILGDGRVVMILDVADLTRIEGEKLRTGIG